MTERPLVPRAGEVIGPGLDALARVRPSAFPFANHDDGRWGDLFVGWSGQVALLLRRLADEAVSARVALARGDALTALTASEFETARLSAPTSAVGTVVLGRGPKPLTGGAVTRGFGFRRDASDTAQPKIASATYAATADVSWPLNAATVRVPVRATRPGAFANAPWIDGGIQTEGLLQLADIPFDRSIRVVSYDASGGSDGQNDEDLRRQASAYAVGQYAPTLGAIVAGALRGTGVHRLAARDVTRLGAARAGAPQGEAAAYTAVTIADASWASGAAWCAAVQQAIVDGFLGHGCAVKVAGVENVRIRCEVTVTLRDPGALTDPSLITAAIQSALRAYFDDRPDWYTWRLSQMRAVVSRAHAQILTCSNAAVRSLATNAVLDEPDPAPPTALGITHTHWMLVANGVSVTYQNPT
jgi:hypothetical protein